MNGDRLDRGGEQLAPLGRGEVRPEFHRVGDAILDLARGAQRADALVLRVERVLQLRELPDEPLRERAAD